MITEPAIHNESWDKIGFAFLFVLCIGLKSRLYRGRRNVSRSLLSYFIVSLYFIHKKGGQRELSPMPLSWLLFDNQFDKWRTPSLGRAAVSTVEKGNSADHFLTAMALVPCLALVKDFA